MDRIAVVRTLRRVLATVAPPLFPGAIGRFCEQAGLGGRSGAWAASQFDVAHYGQMANRSFGSRQAALYHYLLIGSEAGWEPRIGFSPTYYRQKNPDIGLAGYEPFAHHCHFGRHEGRGGSPLEEATPEPEPVPPSLEGMLSRPRAAGSGATVAVIMPVYGSRALALRAIDSVLRAAVTLPFELTVVDDASSDRTLARELEALANAGLIRLLVNERNLGFAASANRGFELHRERDVVLLNSDTCVFDNWLDRLLSVLHAASDIGTATPLSNAATILSYPITLRDNQVTEGECAGVDRLCRVVDREPVDIPTAIGFCMAIRRDCLKQVGAFDADKFGRGYGEENDFCLRATAAGWRHVAATNVMVWHRGGGSFQAAREELIERAQSVLQQLHPSYHPTIKAFIEADPLKETRSALDLARVASDPRPKILGLGAASEDNDDQDELGVRLVPEIGRFFGQRRVCVPRRRHLPNLPRLHDGSSDSVLADALEGLRIRSVRICTNERPLSILEERLINRATERGIPVAVDRPKSVFSGATF